MSYDLYLKVLRILKVVVSSEIFQQFNSFILLFIWIVRIYTCGVQVVIYFVLICWFWRAPVAAISQQLVQPFGNIYS